MCHHPPALALRIAQVAGSQAWVTGTDRQPCALGGGFPTFVTLERQKLRTSHLFLYVREELAQRVRGSLENRKPGPVRGEVIVSPAVPSWAFETILPYLEGVEVEGRVSRTLG